MKDSESKSNNLFLLGAGFTKAVFPIAPLNKDLLSKLCTGSSHTTINKYYREYKTNDIEILLTRLDLDILLPNHKQTALQQDRKEIERQIAEFFGNFRFKKEIIANNTWVEDFVKLFRPYDAIINLNYDCFLEGLLDYYEVWSPNRGYANVENILLGSPTNANNILIYKIHGSENFYEAPPFDKNGPKLEQRCIALVVNESIFPRSGQSRIFGYGGGQTEVRQYIIAPSFVKFQRLEMANMVNKLIAIARDAKNLVIGGCGLRREDMSLWLILASFLNRRLQSTKKLIIIDPSQCDQIKARIANYWTGATDHFTICCIPKTFQDGIEQLTNELRIHRIAKTNMNGNYNKKNSDREERLDFIRAIVAEDNRSGKWGGRVITRFPPEPNGYLHIGHAKSICLNFSIAAENKDGRCHLRFDDTNPCKEELEYVESIMADVRWLGWDWGEHLYYASDYFEQMYEYAVRLIKAGKAYVCDLTGEQIRQYRGTLTEQGKNSPYRDRSIEENLDLFERMRAGEFPDGSRTLRAKIDMASANLNMRDPVMYRILHASHHRTGDKWCIYPMYDWAHGLEDSVEGITHSICTLEFENHRPLYDWFLDQLGVHHPRQIEFARLNLSYTVMSKRKLLQLVQRGLVNGWDDPRMPTISGMRRRGYSPAAIREFCRLIGVNKFNSTVDIALLEHCVRQDLNRNSPRVMAVLRPLKVVIDNYPQDKVEQLEAINNPEDPAAGTRLVPFSRELYIERDDFMEEPPKKFYRLAPGREVRLRYAYFVTCKEAVKNPDGEIIELHCNYDPATRGGDAPDGRKVKSTLHWVSAPHSLSAQVRLYDHLFTKENPDDVANDADFTSNLDQNSLKVINNCRIEPSQANAEPLSRYQFERLGYFCVDPDSTADRLIFNRTVTLRDTWAKIQKAQHKQKT